MKSSAVEALQKSHIENIAAFLGKGSSQTTTVLGLSDLSIFSTPLC